MAGGMANMLVPYQRNIWSVAVGKDGLFHSPMQSKSMDSPSSSWFSGHCTWKESKLRGTAVSISKDLLIGVCLQINDRYLPSKRAGYLIQWKEFLDEALHGPGRSAWLFFEALVALSKTENWINSERGSPGQSLREAEGQLIDFHVSKKN